MADHPYAEITNIPRCLLLPFTQHENTDVCLKANCENELFLSEIFSQTPKLYIKHGKENLV